MLFERATQTHAASCHVVKYVFVCECNYVYVWVLYYKAAARGDSLSWPKSLDHNNIISVSNRFSFYLIWNSIISTFRATDNASILFRTQSAQHQYLYAYDNITNTHTRSLTEPNFDSLCTTNINNNNTRLLPFGHTFFFYLIAVNRRTNTNWIKFQTITMTTIHLHKRNENASHSER